MVTELEAVPTLPVPFRPDNVHPVGELVLVQPDELPVEQVTAGITRLSSGDRPVTGTVLDAGPAVTCAGRGDRVIYRQHAGVDVTLDGLDLLVLRDRDILLVQPAGF